MKHQNKNQQIREFIHHDYFFLLRNISPKVLH